MEITHFRTQELRDICSIANEISHKQKRRNLTVTTERAFYAKETFEKLATHLNSINYLLAKQALKRPDISALAALARTIIELHKIYCYRTERGKSDAELEFRNLVSALHTYTEEILILKKLCGATDKHNDGDAILFRDWVRIILEANEFFNSLTTKQKALVLKGEKSYIYTDFEFKQRILNESIEKGVYKLFSNNIHSFGLGIRYANYGGGVIDSGMLLYLSLEVLIVYSASVITSYTNLRRTVASLLSRNKKQFLNDMKSKAHLEDFIQSLCDPKCRNSFLFNHGGERYKLGGI